jgi:hypothetical protein
MVSDKKYLHIQNEDISINQAIYDALEIDFKRVSVNCLNNQDYWLDGWVVKFG